MSMSEFPILFPTRQPSNPYSLSAFEGALERHAAHPTLEPTYNPALLARAPSLSADISHLLQVDESSWKTHPIHVKLLGSSPEQLTAYVQRIEELSNSSDPSPLLAHSYVRYMGDLSGGQTIRHILSKAYDLDEAAGFGVSFYAFKELRSAKLASLGEMKRIKDWFREGINEAGEQGAEVKGQAGVLIRWPTHIADYFYTHQRLLSGKRRLHLTSIRISFQFSSWNQRNLKTMFRSQTA